MAEGVVERLVSDYGLAGLVIVMLAGGVIALFREVRASYRREVAAYVKTLEANAALKSSTDALAIVIEHRNPLTAVLGETVRAMADSMERLVNATDLQAARGIEDRARAFEALRRIEDLQARAEARDMAR